MHETEIIANLTFEEFSSIYNSVLDSLALYNMTFDHLCNENSSEIDHDKVNKVLDKIINNYGIPKDLSEAILKYGIENTDNPDDCKMDDLTIEQIDFLNLWSFLLQV
jgi:hypothetical protein